MKFKDLKGLQEKETTCPICNSKIKVMQYVPCLEQYHEDMYVSHEAEYQERKELQERIDKAIGYINSHLRQDMLSDFTGASYLQEYIIEPDELLNILQGENND